MVVRADNILSKLRMLSAHISAQIQLGLTKGLLVSSYAGMYVANLTVFSTTNQNSLSTSMADILSMI